MDQWASFEQFLAMGGYAGYVWPSVGLAVGTLLANVLLARRRHAQALQQALRRLAMNAEGNSP
jgi:heme exporter protein CcmD